MLLKATLPILVQFSLHGINVAQYKNSISYVSCEVLTLLSLLRLPDISYGSHGTYVTSVTLFFLTL
jgi:hypothetical protein